MIELFRPTSLPEYVNLQIELWAALDNYGNRKPLETLAQKLFLQILNQEYEYIYDAEDAKNALNDAECDLEDALCRISDLEEKQDELRDKLENRRDETYDLQRQIDDMADENSVLKEEIRALEARLDKDYDNYTL